MKYLKYTCVLMMVAMTVMGCKEKKEAKVVNLNLDEDMEEVSDTTVYGNCYSAMMNSFSLITNNGDTIAFLLDEGGTVLLSDSTSTETNPSDVQGGLLDGDKLAVIAEKINDEDIARKVINLTTLLGRWTSLDKNFEIKDGGVVESHVSAESRPYTSWKIHNGQLVLAPDTFDILTLGPDSLYLENANGIFEFKRQN